MNHLCLHDREEIFAVLRHDPLLHVYSIADLDEFFWPWTTWYGLKVEGELQAIVLIYSGMAIPTMLALTRDEEDRKSAMVELLRSIHHLLPRRFDAHLSPGLCEVLADTAEITVHGHHLKMGLINPAALESFEASESPTSGERGDVVPLDTSDLAALQELYRESYPGNWFDPRMVETGQYFGIRDDRSSVLICAAGVHAVSERYGVAALGNITTRTTHRNRGYARRVTARLCRSLIQQGMAVGLNVSAENEAAIAAYRRIGFQTVAHYDEVAVQLT